jgi:hypothetical protein
VQPGAVVCVELCDGPVTGWLVVEEFATAGPSRQCGVVSLEQGSMLLIGPVSEVKLVGEGVPALDGMPVWSTAVAGAHWAAERARAEAARSALRQHESRLERIVDAAHEYAEENSLCERFDEFMVRQGLRPRSRDWVCVVDATVRVRIPMSAYQSDAAASQVTSH